MSLSFIVSYLFKIGCDILIEVFDFLLFGFKIF